MAAKTGNAQTFKYLLDESKVGSEDLSELIQLCSKHGNADCVQVLLDEGADPTRRPKDNQESTDPECGKNCLECKKNCPECEKNCLNLAIDYSHKYVLSKYSSNRSIFYYTF